MIESPSSPWDLLARHPATGHSVHCRVAEFDIRANNEYRVALQVEVRGRDGGVLVASERSMDWDNSTRIVAEFNDGGDQVLVRTELGYDLRLTLLIPPAVAPLGT